MTVRLTYDVRTSIKEDLSDIVTNISPEDTPVYSMLGRTEAKSTYHEWLEDTLNVPTGAPNPILEGADYTGDTPTARTRKGNYTQIFRRVYRVSATQRAVATPKGIGDELVYQAAKAMKEVSIDVERAIILNATMNAGSPTVPRQMGGIPAFVSTNVLANNGVARALTETLLNDGLQRAWERGGNPNVVICSGRQKRVISSFTAGLTKVVPAEDQTLYASVDVYDSDFGRVQIIAHRQGMPHNRVYILTTEHWKVAYLRPFKREDIPKLGDWFGAAIVGELTLEGRAEQANAIIADLS